MTQVDRWPVTALIPEVVGMPILIDDKQAALSIAVTGIGNASVLDDLWDRPGVYSLLDPVQVDGTFGAHVEQATSLRSRVMQHELDKKTWVRPILIQRDTTDRFTPADVGWLEGTLWALVTASERCLPSNKVIPIDDTRRQRRSRTYGKDSLSSTNPATGK